MNWLIGLGLVCAVLWFSWWFLPLENKRMEDRTKVKQKKKELGIEEAPML